MGRPLSSPLQRSLAGGAVGVGVLLSMRAFLRPRPQAERRLLDWDDVRRYAYARSGAPHACAPADGFAGAAAESDAMAAELARLMAEVCGEIPQNFPRFTILDRRGFVDVNVDIARRLLAPVEAFRATVAESSATALSRGAMNRYVGVLFGIMSQRVLGQYDPVLALGADDSGAQQVPVGSPALFLVEPNLQGFARGADLPVEPLRRWLILHELTHAWQFGHHPWLREHIVQMLDELVRSGLLQATSGGLGGSPRQLVERLPATIRSQLRGISRMQAVMSVLEGYSNFLMHQVGRRHLDRFDELEAAFERRRSQRTPVERVVLAVTGINMKLRQYEVGERFCTAVAQRGGVQLLNRVWERAELMPSPAELREPALWIGRAA